MKKIMIFSMFFLAHQVLLAGDTYYFRIDRSSFTKSQEKTLMACGYSESGQPFENTYLLSTSTSSTYAILKVTPKDQKEISFLFSFLGKGLEIYQVYRLEASEIKLQTDNKLLVPLVKNK